MSDMTTTAEVAAPTDRRIIVLRFGKKHEEYAQFDRSFGKDGSWFTDKGHAFCGKDIFMWKESA